MKECPICVEKKNKFIACLFCNYKTCIDCVETYLLQLQEDPKCLNTSCNKKWNYEVIIKLFPVKSVKILNEHHKKVLFDREKSLLPETQLIVERELQTQKLVEEKKELLNRIKKIKLDISALKIGEIEGERRKFVMACPANGCRGFLSSRWKCGLCEVNVCKECKCIKDEDEEHECDPKIVKSVKLLKKDTKPCPKCGSMIYRIEGCYQMYCTICKTAFNWNNGAIITGNFHNPHHYQEMERNRNGNQGNQQQNGCGLNYNAEWRNYIKIIDKLEDIKINYELQENLKHFHRKLVEFSDMQLNRYLVNVNLTNQDIRKKFLKKEIDDKDFKRILQRREKDREKKIAIYTQLLTFIETCGDIFTYIIRKSKTEKHVKKHYEQLLEQAELANKYLLDISKVYKCVIPKINFEN